LSISGGDWSILYQDYKSIVLYVLAVLVVIAPIWLARRARSMEGDVTPKS
jgi:putative tricarboxylic transport membrane protein